MQQAASLGRRASKASRARPSPFNIELFAGSPDDNNATFFFNGAMAVLKPYIDTGTLVVKSGQTDFKTGRDPALGPGHRPEAHGGHAHQTYTCDEGRTACSRRTTACPSASSRR